jgi:hypothetical protein
MSSKMFCSLAISMRTQGLCCELQIFGSGIYHSGCLSVYKRTLSMMLLWWKLRHTLGVKLDVSANLQKVLIVCYPSNLWEFCRCRRQSGVLLNYQAQSLSSAESFSKRIEMGVSRSLNPNSIKHWHLKAWTRVVWQTLVGPLWFTFTLEFLGPWRVYVYHMQHDVVIFHHHTWRQLKCRLS